MTMMTMIFGKNYSVTDFSDKDYSRQRFPVHLHYSLLLAPSKGGIIASQCSNLRSPMLNSLPEWDERCSTRVFRGKPAKNASNFEGVYTVTIAF